MLRTRFAILAAAFAALLAASSCSSKVVIPEEALQIPAHSRVHTATNLWFKDPQQIGAPACLQGKILPFGSEIEFISATDSSIRFRDIDTGAEYRIVFDKAQMMMAIDDYMRKTFTTKSADDVAKDLKPSVYEKLRRGVVEEGMTRDMVLLAFGYPAPNRTSSLKDETWIYWDDILKSRRVVFKGEKVIAIIDAE